MTSPTRSPESTTRVPGFFVITGTIIGSVLLERTLYPQMADLLPGPAWEALCRVIYLLSSVVFWMGIVPDLLSLHSQRKARKVDGTHEQI